MKRLQNLIEEKESEFHFLISNKYRGSSKNTFNWKENEHIVFHGKQSFDLDLLDSYIKKNFEDTFKETINDVFQKKPKKIAKYWNKCIEMNNNVIKDYEDSQKSYARLQLLF